MIESITLSEFSPENFTKVNFLCKIGMIYTFSSIFPLIMVLEPNSLFLTRSPNAMFGHICPRGKCLGGKCLGGTCPGGVS